MDKTAVVTGAGSGVGRAVALRLANEGWSVALVGREAAKLNETRSLAGPFADQLFVTSCDVSDAKAVEAIVPDVMEELGSVAVLVNSAGTNTPQRGLGVLSVEQYKQLIDVNLNGTFYCVHAFLPVMRKQGEGTIVNIVSDAGLIANSKAGAAYVASKFGVTGLTPRSAATASAPARSFPATSTRRCCACAPSRPRRRRGRRCCSRRTWQSA